MDLLGDPLATRPILKRWEVTIELYQSWRFTYMDDPDRQFGNGSVWTQTHTGRDVLELLLKLGTHARMYETSQFVLQLPPSSLDCSFTERSPTDMEHHSTTSGWWSGEPHAAQLLSVWYCGSATLHHHRYSETSTLRHNCMYSEQCHSRLTPPAEQWLFWLYSIRRWPWICAHRHLRRCWCWPACWRLLPSGTSSFYSWRRVLVWRPHCPTLYASSVMHAAYARPLSSVWYGFHLHRRCFSQVDTDYQFVPPSTESLCCFPQFLMLSMYLPVIWLQPNDGRRLQAEWPPISELQRIRQDVGIAGIKSQAEPSCHRLQKMLECLQPKLLSRYHPWYTVHAECEAV